MNILSFTIGTILLICFGWGKNSSTSGILNVKMITDKISDQINLSDQKTLLFFHAKWCGACVSFEPKMESFAKWAAQHQPQLQIYDIDYDQSPIMATRFGITRLPTLL